MMGLSSEGREARNVGAAELPPAVPEHQLLLKIANGSYGEIWLARSHLGAYRAVKIVRRSKFPDARPYEREYNGVRNFEPVSRQHDGFLDILQVGRNEEQGFFYYVMELADDAARTNVGTGEKPGGDARGPGGSSAPEPSPASVEPRGYVPRTLAYEIRERSPLPLEEVIRISISLLGALQYLHEKRLIHRDLKPSNIVFVNGRPKLADVGLVSELGDSLSLVGTMGYMPAEGPGTPQADLYSLGKVLYEAATGKDRQEFPELPSQGQENDIDPKLLELNQVLLKACAREVERRYQTATEMLADLKRLQDGDSLIGIRARQRTLRHWAVIGGVAAAVLIVAALVWGSLRPPGKKLPEFSDDFEAPQLDTNKWVLGQKVWTPAGHDEFPGLHGLKSGQRAGELVLQTTTLCEEGWTTSAAQWLDSARDFRPIGECLVDIEFSGFNRNAITCISMAGADSSAFIDDPKSVRLFATDRVSPNKGFAYGPRTVRIHLLPDFKAAVVYPDARDLSKYEIALLGDLPQWRLRMFSWAYSSNGQEEGEANLTIKRVETRAIRHSNLVVGFVVGLPDRRPVAGAEVLSETGRKMAETRSNGGFLFPGPLGPISLRVHHPDYHPSEPLPIPGDPLSRGTPKIALQKREEKFGDVLQVIRHEDPGALGFLGTDLFLIGMHYPNATHCETLMKPVDIAASCVLAPEWRFSAGDHILSSFSQCGDLILGTQVHPGAIFELDRTDKTARRLVRPTTASGRHIDWPAACAFDGQDLWILEADFYAKAFGLHQFDGGKLKAESARLPWPNSNAVAPQTLTAKCFLPIEERWLTGLAWDAEAQAFWISVGAGAPPDVEGRVYLVSREAALRERRLEPARVRSFSGRYERLAWSPGSLWGTETTSKQICRIKITD